MSEGGTDTFVTENVDYYKGLLERSSDKNTMLGDIYEELQTGVTNGDLTSDQMLAIWIGIVSG
jgi:hypothetical protein